MLFLGLFSCYSVSSGDRRQWLENCLCMAFGEILVVGAPLAAPPFRAVREPPLQGLHHLQPEFPVLRQSPCPGGNTGMHMVYRKHSVMPGQSAGHVIGRRKTTKLSAAGRASRPRHSRVRGNPDWTQDRSPG